MVSDENVIFTNSFGTVTDKRIIVSYKNAQEDIPIPQINSTSFKHRRSYFFGIGGFVLAIGVLLFMLNEIKFFNGTQVLIMVVIILIALLSGLANWIGHYDITLVTSGKDRKPIKVEMAKTREGREFYNAISKVVGSK
jgi:hypothetical protein